MPCDAQYRPASHAIGAVRPVVPQYDPSGQLCCTPPAQYEEALHGLSGPIPHTYPSGQELRAADEPMRQIWFGSHALGCEVPGPAQTCVVGHSMHSETEERPITFDHVPGGQGTCVGDDEPAGHAKPAEQLPSGFGASTDEQ